MKAFWRSFVAASVVMAVSVSPVRAQQAVQATQPQQASPAPPQTDGVPDPADRVRYERPDSHTVRYNAPDPNVQPVELRMQDMERRIGELEAELTETEQRLRDTILSVNQLHRQLGR